MNLASEYQRRYEQALLTVAENLSRHFSELLAGQARIDRVSARAKSVSRFVDKAEATDENGKRKYQDPLNEIQDQIGVRIITFYLSDVERIAVFVEKYFRHIESRTHVPESEWQFGYFGKHYVLLMPSDVLASGIDKSLVPPVLELQIKTLFQHAWSEANHDLGYKPSGPSVDPDQNRKLAFASAQAWGADQIFESLYQSQDVKQR